MKLPKLTVMRNVVSTGREHVQSTGHLQPSGCNPFTCDGRCDCAYDLCKAAGLPGCDVIAAGCHAFCRS